MGGYRFDAELGRGMTMSSVFELGGTAVNKNTAMAISGGTNYDRKRNHSQEHFKNKPLVPDLPENKTPEFLEKLKNRIGIKRGRLTVVSWFGHGKWLCRCSCGDYVSRNEKSLRPEKLHKFDACPDCENVVFLKKKEHWLKTGKDMDMEDFA